MYRNRWLQILLCLAGLAAITYGIVSLYLPSPRWMIVGVKKRTGDVRTVEQHITFLPPLQYYRLKFERRGGWAQRDGMIRITSQEGVPVTVAFRLRFGIASHRLADARRIVDEGFNAWIRQRVFEAVSAVASKVPIEELLSPTSQFNARRDVLRSTVANHLARSGLNVTAFEIARIEADRDALLRVKRAELRRDARSVPTRVAIFALDGADWDLLRELASDGRIPNISALTSGGASTSLQTIQPTVSPMIWTTIATGLTPDRHGVIDFIDHQHHTPIDAYSRHAPTLWEIADAFGRPAVVADWWTAWPPAPHSASVFYDTPGALVSNAVYPPDLGARADALDVPVETIQYAQARRFLNISEEEWNKGIQNPNDPISVFRAVLAKTWSDHRVAINLYNDERRQGGDPQLIMVSYEGTDAVNHLFAPFHPPDREGVASDGYRKFWPAVANYYAEIDRLIGEWMGVLPRDTTVMIVSGYGFRWEKDRPRQIPTGIAALSDHRNPGVFIAYGPHVAAARGYAMSVYDVAPTVLTLLGLPKSLEMPGNLAKWAFKDIVPLTSVRVVNYSEFVGERPLGTSVRVDPKDYEHMLLAIGHVSDPNRAMAPVLESEDQPPRTEKPLPPEKWGAYAYANNLGVQLRAQGKLKEATDAFQNAIDLNPSRPAPYLNLAMVLFDRQDYTDANIVFVEAVSRGLPNAEQWFVDFAALYRQHDMASRAIVLLAKGQELFPQSYLIAANYGSALVAASRFTEGVPELERALGMQPSSTMVLNNLGLFYSKHKDFGRALDYWNRSLSIEPHQPQIREAAMAARSML
jgi:predicted AlkP superfamily phosphohydrolase/phosphomutase/Tfp pilus assembly protein PilF